MKLPKNKYSKQLNCKFCNTRGRYVPEYFHLSEVGLITKTQLTVAESSEKKQLQNTQSLMLNHPKVSIIKIAPTYNATNR